MAMQMLQTLSRLYQMIHNTKGAERQNTSFPKELIENADLYKPVLNKIMTIHE